MQEEEEDGAGAVATTEALTTSSADNTTPSPGIVMIWYEISMIDIMRLPTDTSFDGNDDFCLFGKLVPTVSSESMFGIECPKKKKKMNIEQGQDDDDDDHCMVYQLQLMDTNIRHRFLKGRKSKNGQKPKF